MVLGHLTSLKYIFTFHGKENSALLLYGGANQKFNVSSMTPSQPGVAPELQREYQGPIPELHLDQRQNTELVQEIAEYFANHQGDMWTSRFHEA